MDQFFSFDGRVRRITIWVNALISVVAYLIMAGIVSSSQSTIAVVLVILMYLALAIRGLSVSVRRWHDLNKSGAWVFITLVPIVGAIYAFVMQGFMPGGEGANSYGPAPEEGQYI